MRRGAVVALAVLFCCVLALVALYRALLYTPLAVFLHREPLVRVNLQDIVTATGWTQLRRARLLHAERRQWLDDTILAELELPDRDATALLQQLRQQQRRGGLESYNEKMAIPEAPYWWRPTPASPQEFVGFWKDPGPEAIASALSITHHHRGTATVHLLWIQT